jgi:hypothetical protein
MGAAAGQAVPPRVPRRAREEEAWSAAWGVRSQFGSARAAARLESRYLPSPECECCKFFVRGRVQKPQEPRRGEDATATEEEGP